MTTPGTELSYPRPPQSLNDSFGATGAGADVCGNIDADAGDDASDENGENGETGYSGVAPSESKTPPCDELLFRSPRPAGMSILKSRAAV